MAKHKDMLNEVAPVIKLDILQKYFLDIHRFKEIQKKTHRVSGRGDENYIMGIRTDYEKSRASDSSRLESDVEF